VIRAKREDRVLQNDIGRALAAFERTVGFCDQCERFTEAFCRELPCRFGEVAGFEGWGARAFGSVLGA
jgi:hypothetical protein